ncbi:MAG: hypothetical protein HGA70_00020 [Chlorobiaceae bacterium]|nr:hypothetical protein [Chlorobiaceae bacterium]NTW10908.1 hypothetical protein [Chlorobiaceae bacterium]
MKFLAIMGHRETRPMERDMFRKYQASMFSIIDIKGCRRRVSREGMHSYER